MLTKLIDLGYVGTGTTPSMKNPDYYNSNDILFIKPSDINDNGVTELTDSEFFISNVARKKARIIPKNTILCVCIGSIGKIAITTKESSCNQQINYIIPSEDHNAKFLAYSLLSRKNELIRIGSDGPVVPIINKSRFENIEIIIFDYNKETEIANELDNIRNIINIKQNELNHLDELIKSRFIEMFGDRLINLNKKMSSIATPVIGLTYKPSNVTKDGTIVLRSGNIQNNELQLEEDIVRVSNINISEQKWIKDKDILMCSRNGSARLVGKSCLIRHPKEQMSFGAFMTVVRTKYPYFLQGFFTSDYFKNQLTGVGTASVNQITSGMLNNYDVIEPTEVEEKEFESYVKQIDKSKFIVQQEIKDLQELLDKKMDEYFGQ